MRSDIDENLPLCLVMGDVNNLKIVNDALGHIAGDRLLATVAQILKKNCRDDDLIARYGGDEFIILLTKCEEKKAEGIINNIKTSCKTAFADKIPASLALGMAIKDTPGKPILAFLNTADERMYANKSTERTAVYRACISLLETFLYEKDYATVEHSMCVGDLCVQFALALKLGDSLIDELTILSALHDIGKITIPASILRKDGPLTKEEWNIVKQHTTAGYTIAKTMHGIGFIAEDILSHHERWDGKGYPRGLAGEQIPLAARILSIADSFDVMTHDRPYKKKLTQREALKEIERCRGSQFDPALTDAFITQFENFYVKSTEGCNNLRHNTSRKLDNIFSAMPVVLFTLKSEGGFRLTFVTKNTLELLGYESEELINNAGLWVECIHAEERERVLSGFSELVKKGYYTCEYRFKCKSGKYIWVQITLKLLKEEDNLPGEIVGCLRNISPRKAAEEELLRKTAELERSNAELERFAHIAAHDLQEPLRTISSYLQLIERKCYFEAFDEKGKNYFARVIKGAERMRDMVNDLLEYSRAVSVREEFVLCDCAELLQEAIDSFSLLIKEKQATVICGPMPIVRGNPNQLLRVFQNIIGNGLKFCKDEEAPVIEISSARKSGAWYFYFRDNGIGIREESKERIFEIFQRLNAREKYQGTGIGLAVCEKVIANHGGEIMVESEFGKGSTFYFSIPDKKEEKK